MRFESVDWSRLTHAHGPATNVPELLQLLSDPDEEVREDAIMELCDCINHQGSIYEATVAVVPFLLQLAQDLSLPDRAAMLIILEGIAREWNAAVRDQPSDPADWGVRWSGIAERAIYERPYRQAAHQAVEDRLDVLEKLLQDPSVEVRSAAAFLLATFLERGEQAARVLLTAVDEETEDFCRAAIILALAQLLKQFTESEILNAAIFRFRHAQSNDQTGPDSRLCAGLALLHLGDGGKLEETLALARPRLSVDRRHFQPFPSATFSKVLFGLVCDSLRAWSEATRRMGTLPVVLTAREDRQAGCPSYEARVRWIREGLAHQDVKVVSKAFFEMSRLCREVRWGPSRFIADVLRLVNATDQQIRRDAVTSLNEMGPEGLQHLAELTRHPEEPIRAAASRYLEEKGKAEAHRMTRFNEKRPDRLPAVETLVGIIEEHRDSRRGEDEEKVTEALTTLGLHGPAAKTAVDHIRGLTKARSPEVRIAAIRTLWKVTHDAAVVVPLLIENLHPEPRYGFLVIEQLRELGPAARAAIPALKQIVDSEFRFADEGCISTCCSDDHAFQAAATKALLAIES